MQEDETIPEDAFLKDKLARTERLLRDGEVTHATRVIPVGEALPAQQWVLPGQQALEYIRQARAVALVECECRTHYRRCSHPTEVCLVLDDSAEREIAGGSGRPISVDEAAAVLRRAEEAGLVHLAIYAPGQQVSAVCSCCACCCHNLQLLQRYGRPEMVARADYVAVTDPDLCRQCGTCAERCAFGARVWEDGTMHYRPEACFGCGVCVAACPSQAIRLRRRAD